MNVSYCFFISRKIVGEFYKHGASSKYLKKKSSNKVINSSSNNLTSHTIVEAEICPDHVHMLVEIPPKMSVSGFVGFLKGKSSLMIYQKWGNMKFKYRNRQFWCRGFYVDTVGKNTERIKEYIRNQLKEDAEQMQLAIEFPDDPLNG